MSVRPADFPPPFTNAEAIGTVTDAPDERIDVGILIVGGGPGGLACAVRLGQLLEEHPETRELLGDVPVAVLEKGKQPGSHLLSGAVMNARAIRKLFAGRIRMEEMPTYGPVHGEAVYLLTKGAALRIPPPPTMMNHGNWIVSVSELGRFLAEQAEAAGVMILPETAGQTLLVDHGRVVGARTGDKGRGRDGEPLSNFEPGVDVTARITVLAEGTAGHLTTAAIDHFGLEGQQPADLGARREGGLEGREAAPQDRPHDGLAASQAGEVRRVRRLVHLPDGRGARVDRLRRRARVRRRRALRARRPPGVQDAPPRPEDPRRRRACRLGREDDHRGRPAVAAVEAERAGPAPRRRGRGARQRPPAQGRPLRDRVGSPRRRGGSRGAPARRGGAPAGRPRRLRRIAPRELRVEGARRGAEHAPGLRQGLLHGRRARERDDGDEGEAAAEGLRHAPERGRAADPHGPRRAVPGAGRHAHLRQALVGLRVGEPDARRSAEPRPRPDEVPRDLAEMWQWMCPAHVYEVATRTATARSR